MTGKSELEDLWPLSPLQEGFLFHALFDNHALDVYIIQCVLEFEGPLDPVRLRTAAQALLDRHSCLRTAFVLVNDPPVQVVVREVQVPWTEVDLSDRMSGDWSRQFDRLMENDRIAHFDLQTPPLLRFLLVKLSGERHRLVLSVHHILVDGWSLPLVAGELFTLYASNGDGAALPPARSYRDYLVWLSARDHAADSAAWEHALAGLEEPTLLVAADPTRPPVLPEQVTVDVSEGLVSRLTSLARARSLTMNTLMQAGWAIVLSWSTGRWDVVFGTTVSGRPPELAESESMIGLFINTIPVRVRLDPAESVADLLTRIQAEQAQLFDHQHIGLAELQRNVGIGDLFDTLLVFESQIPEHRATARALDSTGITLTGIDQSGSTHYPISLVAVLSARLEIRVNYRPDLFDLASVQVLANRLVRALEVMADDPGIRLSAVDALSAQQRQQMLVAWNDTAAYTENATVPEMFIAHMTQTPDAIAVVCGDESVTYAELGERAERLAYHLIAHGAGPEHAVGVCLERSVELVVALVGVLQAGAAFVALEPGWPVARIAQVCRSAGVAAVVGGAGSGGWPEGVAVLDMDRLLQSGGVEPGGAVPVDPEGLAYVVFTSGSTGVPKGVMVRHGAIAARLSWQRELLDLGVGDAVLFKAPLGFDISINEVFLPLVSGARLVVAKPGGERDVEYLLEVIERERVTFAYLVSSMLDLLLELPDVGVRARELRHVWCGGEALGLGLFDRFQARLNAVMYHGYGPAEATIGVTYQFYRPGQPRDGVTIGRPNPNTRIYLLDQGLRPVPVGVTGELYVGGLPLGRGYVNDPAQTASRFVADPFTPGQRLYRTGDLARWRPDGVLEFHGRADNQIKIRGMRIELEEIEAVLGQHSHIRQAVVTTDTTPSGTTRLLGYYLPTHEHLDHTQLHTWTATRLPEHMVPTTFIPLDTIPLTPNGKINRQKLPLPDWAEMQSATRKPTSSQEQVLCELFAEVLGLSEVGVDDSFFELGGDSIIAIQLVSRARKRDLSISPREVFQHRTPAALAALMVAAEPVVAPVSDPDGVGSFPRLPIVQRLSQRGGPIGRFNQSMLVRVPAAANLKFLDEILQAVLDRHDGLRLRLTRHTPVLWSLEATAVGSVCAGDLLRRVDVAGLDVAGLRAVIAAESDAAAGRLDPDAGVMLQAVWFDAGRVEPGRLLVVAHHLVIDGVSWRILLEDFAAAWEAVRAGKPPELDSVGTSLRSFARTFVEQAHEPVRISELEHWTQTLAPGGDLMAGATTAGTVSGACHYEIQFPVADTVPLLTSVPAAANADVTEVLVAALRVAVSRWHESHGRDGSMDLLVDLERHGRQEIVPGVDLSRTVGWFTSIAPVRLSASPDVLSALKVVKERLRAMPDGGIGYGMLRYANAEVAPLLAGASQPQVLFNYLGRFDIGQQGDWAPAAESDAVTARPDAEMVVAYPLTINAVCVDTSEGPQLQATFTHLVAVLSAEDAHELADGWATALRELTVWVAAGEGGGTLTPSDLGILSLSQQEIDLLQQASTAPVEDVWPLSPLQEGLAFHALFDEQGLDVYTVQFVFELEGLLDAGRLRAAAQALLDRHSCLRTAFMLVNDPPVQVVVCGVQVPWTEVDLSDCSEEDRSDQFDQLAANDRIIRFDLQSPPLLRFLLVKIDETHHRLVLWVHHILMDGWSVPLVMGDLFALYASGGDGSGLPKVRPFRDHLVWLSTRDRVAASVAWAQALKGIERPTLLAAADRTRPPVLPERVDADISEGLTSRLTSFARAQGLTMNTVVQMAWAMVLSCVVGRLDVVFGATVSGRPPELPKVESMVGLFINTIPVRIRLDPAESLADLLHRIQDEQSRLLDHQYIGLAEIQRQAGIATLFDTLTVFESYPFDSAKVIQPLESTGIIVAGAQIHDATHYPISLLVIPGTRLEIMLKYRPDIFDSVSVGVLADRLVRVLETVAADPSVRVGEVDVLSADERHQLLVEWNSTAAQVPAASLPELFAAQVARTPDNTAVVFEDVSLNYTELNTRANQLARHLACQGIGPEDVVALAMPRSVDMVVGILGVLKAGAAYLPIDPHYPDERIRFMLTDSHPALVLTTTHLAAELPTSSEVPRLVLDDPETIITLNRYLTTDVGDTDRARSLHPLNSAYIIYTSGSTGQPKAVTFPCVSLVNLMAWHLFKFSGISGTKTAQFTALSFDVAVQEILSALLAGKTLMVPPDSVRSSLEELASWLDLHHVNEIFAPNVVVEGLCKAAGEQGIGLASLRDIAQAGEALTLSQRVRDFFRDRPSLRLHNHYGPAETHVATAYTLPAHTSEWPLSPPIGRPLKNLQVYVLGEELAVVPVGVLGELYIGGIQVARGYLHRSALTASRFVANPFTPGERLYRTGDLAQWRPDGVLEFHGRADNQIKIRGMRVEIEEIEAILGQHPHIRQAVVTTDTTPSGTTRLLGYYLPTHERLDHTQLRTWIANRLPEHMVPATFAPLDTLPLTPNGKINRQKLPALSFDREPGYVEFVAPRSIEEMTVAKVWAEVLGLNQVGRNDNFFELGGDSLLGARVVLRLREVFQIEIPLRELFRLQTVSGLATALTSSIQVSSKIDEPAQLLASSTRGQQPLVSPPWPAILPPLTRHRGNNVLLTGASGFFGAFLLREILAQYQGTVHCLVRADSRTRAWEKLRANLEHYGLSEVFLSQNRIRVVLGDLAQPRLALENDEYERLTDEIDLIIHNGAHVDFLHSYETVEAANVNGTRALIWLAATTWLKPLRFVSTIGVAGYRPSVSGGESGYVESKWRAEQVVTEARAHGIPAAVYRVPRLSGDSTTGRSNDRDIVLRIIRWILDLGVAPDIEIAGDWIPVDEAARLLVGHYPEAEHGGLFSLTAQRRVRLTEIVELARQIGHEIEYKPALEWGRELASRSVEEYEVLASALRIDSAGSAPDADIPAPPDGASLDDGFVPVLARGVTEQILRRYLHTMSSSRRIG